MDVKKVAVVGTGLMGRGIVEAVASAGYSVVAIKATPGDTSKAQGQVAKSIDKKLSRGKITQEDRDALLGRIEFTTEIGVVSGCELVIESALENMEAKVKLLTALESHMKGSAVLASNTSSLSLTDLAGHLARPANFFALHFFNPAQIMKLVEIGVTEHTSQQVIEDGKAFCASIGKTGVILKAMPGYVVNRLLVPYLLHGIETLESGIGSAEDIDTAMKLGCGHPMGPLALSDLIGLDVVSAMAKTLLKELNDSRYKSPKLLNHLLEKGLLGRKSGAGIFDYSGEKPVLSAEAKSFLG